MAEAPASERTEKPTPKKLREAREKGQVPRSRDLAAALSLLAVVLALTRLGPGLGTRLADTVGGAFQHLGEVSPLLPNEMGATAWRYLALLALTTGPLLAIGGGVGVLSTLAQSGWTLAPQALQVNWERLSPSNGLARLAPRQAGVDLLKQVLAVTIVGVLAWSAARSLAVDAPRLAGATAAEAARFGWNALLQLLSRAGFGLLVVAGGDYGVQRWRHWSSMKMTKQEIRDESKANDGSPEIKARVRKIQREMTRSRMLKAVKTATVVVTNPTHYAVALEYRRERTAAPIVVAKGADHMAARIKRLARDHGVPTVENVALAQALYKTVDVGEQIPAALFGAVAEILAYLVRLKQLML